MKQQIKDEVIDELLTNYQTPSDLFGSDGLLNELKKRLIERAMDAELTTHLGYPKHGKTADEAQPNSRNGHSSKTIKSGTSSVTIDVPRDRIGEYDPLLIPKHQRHFEGFDDVIISLYSHGLSTRDIAQHLKQLYNVEVSPTLISNVTDCVVEEVRTWQSRPLEQVYLIVYFDAIVSKVRHEGRVSNRAIHIALGINLEGKKEVLGMWACPNEGAKFWLQVLSELKNRGLADILICCVDGLAGFADAIHTVYPQAKVQLCIVHMIRNSLNFVQCKRRKQIANELKSIYTAPTVESAQQALQHFSEKYDKEYPAISQSWQRNWQYITPFFDYRDEIRKVIYTTNAIESFNSSLRKISRSRHSFPTQESLFKLYYLSLRNISKKWTMPIANWPQALNRFIIEFQDRIPL